MISLLRSRLFWLDMARLQVGLFLFGLAIALMLEARIGLDPWSAFHEVVSQRSGLSFGRIAQITGLVLIVGSRVVLSVRPGIATVLNMLLIGPWVDVMRPFVGFADGFGEAHLQFSWRSEGSAGVEGLFDGIENFSVRVTQDQWSPGTDEVDEAIPVSAVDVAAIAVRDE